MEGLTDYITKSDWEDILTLFACSCYGATSATKVGA